MYLFFFIYLLYTSSKVTKTLVSVFFKIKLYGFDNIKNNTNSHIYQNKNNQFVLYNFLMVENNNYNNGKNNQLTNAAENAINIPAVRATKHSNTNCATITNS